MVGRLVVTCVPWSLCLGNFFRPRKVCSLVCGYLHALVVRALVVRVGWKWLPARLEPCALLVGSGYLHALVVRALVVGVSLCALVVGRLVVGGYLCALELVLCWLVSLVGVVTCMP